MTSKNERSLLYIVRHGDAHFNASDRERVLSSFGEEQAKLAGAFLVKELQELFGLEVGVNTSLIQGDVRTEQASISKSADASCVRILVRTSGYKRAEQTASVIEGILTMGLGDKIVLTHEIEPNLAPCGDFTVEADCLRYAKSTTAEIVLLVSHMPFVAELAYTLGDKSSLCFDNCEVAVFEAVSNAEANEVTYNALKHYIPTGVNAGIHKL